MDIKARFDILISRGTQLKSLIPQGKDGPYFWVDTENISEFRAWLSSVANLILVIAPPSNSFIEQVEALLKHGDLMHGIPSKIFFQMLGLLSSASEEFEHGLLGKIEYIIAAATFDDFLDHATTYHKGNRKIEASVLASVVLEDTIKKIASKNSITVISRSLESLIDDLVKAEVFLPVKAKRIKGFAAVRNHALHAEWDNFDTRDVSDLITGTRELLEKYL